MILRLRSAEVQQVQQSRNATAAPIWNAIFATQQQPPGWFITQADHAHLAGEIAAKISAQQFPRLSPEVLQAISLHDEAGTTATPVDRHARLSVLALWIFCPRGEVLFEPRKQCQSWAQPS